MIIRTILAVLVAFALGMSVSLLVDASPIVEQATETISIFSNPKDVPSPSDTLKDGDIHVYPNRVEIDIAGAIPVIFTDTNSMGRAPPPKAGTRSEPTARAIYQVAWALATWAANTALNAPTPVAAPPG